MEEIKNGKRSHSKGHWRYEEDRLLFQLVQQFGPSNWNLIKEKIQGRTGRSCWLRWFNHLDPHANRGPFNNYEETMLVELHRIYGNRWAKIAVCFPDRTVKQLKNQYHLLMERNGKPAASDLSSIGVANNQTGFLKNVNPMRIIESTPVLENSMNPNLSPPESAIPSTSNPIRIMHTNKLADYSGDSLAKVPEFVEETKIFTDPAKDDSHVYNVLPTLNLELSMMAKQEIEDKMMQKKPRFYDFLGVGNIE